MGSNIATMSHGDIGIWIIEMRRRGIKEFKFGDLPKNLQIRGLIRKARILGIIRRLENNGRYAIWKFEDHDRIK